MNVAENHVKILFRYYSDVLEEEIVETMWAIPIDIEHGLYQLDNIPFYGPLVASDDIVLAEYDESESMLTYRMTVESSGNSIILVIVSNRHNEIESIREIFLGMGCKSEKLNEKYFAMEVPVSCNYSTIKKQLEAMEMQEILEYAEPCLSEIHQDQLL